MFTFTQIMAYNNDTNNNIQNHRRTKNQFKTQATIHMQDDEDDNDHDIDTDDNMNK
jgi:hypothetical protein